MVKHVLALASTELLLSLGHRGSLTTAECSYAVGVSSSE